MDKFIKKRSKTYFSSLFALLTILIALSGLAFYQIRKTEFIREKYTELSAISDLKARHIYFWREDKIGDAEAIAEDPFFISTVDFYLRTRNRSDLRDLHKWMQTFKEHKGFSSVCILNEKLTTKIGDSLMALPDTSFLANVLREKEAVVSDLFLLPNGSVVMDLYVPLIYRQGIVGKTVGLVILRIDPYEYLYKELATWPTKSLTSEIILWKQTQDSISFLNKLRHSDQLPLTQKFSISDKKLVASKAFRGVRGIVEGNDYRGVPVLADIREIPNTGWIFIAKTDMDEVFAPLRDITLLVVLLGFLLTVATAWILGLLWRSQKASFYKKLFETELDKKALLKNFEFLTKYANDVILLTDSRGNITYSNEKATDLYSYSAEELRSLNINHLDASNSPDDLEKIFMRAAEEGGLVYEAVHKRKDGTTFPVESSSRFIEVEGTVFFQSIIRDVTEKKKDEEQLFKALREKEVLLKEVHHRVKNNLQTINSLLNLQASTIEDGTLRRFFLDTQNRIKSMAIIHQELYTFNLSSINTLKYVTELISQLTHSFDINPLRIRVNQKVDDKLISIDLAIPLGLIITEILTNIFKHAFPDNRKGNVFIELTTQKGRNILRIADDGIGLPDNFDIMNTSSLGMQLIYTLTEQIDGTIEVHNKKGTEFIIHYNEPEMVAI